MALNLIATLELITSIFAPSEELSDYLAPELDSDILTDADGFILAVGDTVSHIDGGTGTIYAIGDSPYVGEDFMTAYVVWSNNSADHFAGHVLRLAVQ